MRPEYMHYTAAMPVGATVPTILPTIYAHHPHHNMTATTVSVLPSPQYISQPTPVPAVPMMARNAMRMQRTTTTIRGRGRGRGRAQTKHQPQQQRNVNEDVNVEAPNDAHSCDRGQFNLFYFI